MWRARRSQRRRRQPPTPEGALDTLPTEIQDDMLAHLLARDVVRTSVLSPAWRRRWEFVSDLDISIHSWETAAGVLRLPFLAAIASYSRLFKILVSIRGVPLGFTGRADNWLRLVPGKRPRSVSLDLPVRDSPAALAELRLRSCALPAPPVGFAGFHALAALSLDGVLFPAENGWRQVEAMLAAAPGLQELSLKHIVFHVADRSIPGKWVIGGANLRRLVLCLRLAGAGSWELGELPKLEDANVTLN
ncbi:hypothetical protein C2845_PM04G07380 [Panicum miliaceum]|uniref:F-box domain-containing protein n=1 Tax=Panicum miliaceum TaxID=4540 RepID=A0A3L6QLZ2_PANMI|nr:hypothetical protein C2845_PM04G07380 [Panicum miliaceum]